MSQLFVRLGNLCYLTRLPGKAFPGTLRHSCLFRYDPTAVWFVKHQKLVGLVFFTSLSNMKWILRSGSESPAGSHSFPQGQLSQRQPLAPGQFLWCNWQFYWVAGGVARLHLRQMWLSRTQQRVWTGLLGDTWAQLGRLQDSPLTSHRGVDRQELWCQRRPCDQGNWQGQRLHGSCPGPLVDGGREPWSWGWPQPLTLSQRQPVASVYFYFCSLRDVVLWK